MVNTRCLEHKVEAIIPKHIPRNLIPIVFIPQLVVDFRKRLKEFVSWNSPQRLQFIFMIKLNKNGGRIGLVIPKCVIEIKENALVFFHASWLMGFSLSLFSVSARLLYI